MKHLPHSSNRPLTWLPLVVAALLGGCAAVSQRSAMQETGIPEVDSLSTLQKIATVDERFQSYNVEMVEVTGGRFWAPYGGAPGETYRQRPAENLADMRLCVLARHLGPSYMRVSGTWANSTYMETEGENLSAPPRGYDQVLTRARWRGVVDFAKDAPQTIPVSGRAKVWTLESASLDAKTLMVNGREPRVGADGSLSGLDYVSIAQRVSVPGKSIVFVIVEAAGNSACR